MPQIAVLFGASAAGSGFGVLQAMARTPPIAVVQRARRRGCGTRPVPLPALLARPPRSALLRACEEICSGLSYFHLQEKSLQCSHKERVWLPEPGDGASEAAGVRPSPSLTWASTQERGPQDRLPEHPRGLRQTTKSIVMTGGAQTLSKI